MRHCSRVEPRAERIVGVERLDRLDQFVDVHDPAPPAASLPTGEAARCATIIDCAVVGRRRSGAARPSICRVARPARRFRRPTALGHLPMQKRLKMAPSRSSALNAPVISPSASCAEAQLLGEAARARRRRAAACAPRARGARARALQRVDVAGAGDEEALAGAACQPASSSRRRAQGVEAFAGARRDARAPSSARRRALQVDLVEDVEQAPGVDHGRPAGAPRSRRRRRRSRRRRAASGRAGRRPRRRPRSRPRCARRRCARPRRPLSRRPAVSTTWTGTPSIWIVCADLVARRARRSRVTIASSAPASALSSELLPTLGWPARTTRMPSRSSAPWRARSSTASTPRARRAASRPRASALLEEVDLLLGKVERRLDQHAQLDQRVGAARRSRSRTRRRASAPPSAPPPRCWRRSGRRRPRPGRGRACR